MSTSPKSDPGFAERLDALKFISQTHRGLFAARVKSSNRFLSATVAFYLLAIAGRFGNWSNSEETKSALSVFEVKLAIWILFLALALFTLHSLWRVRDADAKNAEVAEKAENEIIRLVASKDYPAVPPHERHININRHFLVRHAWFVILLAVVSAFLLTTSLPQ